MKNNHAEHLVEIQQQRRLEMVRNRARDIKELMDSIVNEAQAGRINEFDFQNAMSWAVEGHRAASAFAAVEDIKLSGVGFKEGVR